MPFREHIDRFIEYFQTQNKEIATLEARHIFRKVLYLIEIDSMSRAAFPSIHGNKERVVAFIDTCSNWPDKDRVSAVLLKSELADKGIRSGRLYELVNRHIDSWENGSIMPPRFTIQPEDDLTLQAVQSIMTKEENKFIDKARYKELLYTYRNHLLHEFREPGNGMDLKPGIRTPYYLGMEEESTQRKSWELVFPVQYLHELCENCINGLKAYLSAENLNPYDAYKFGPMWRRFR